ncbi:ethanolamine ammonia lyase-activating protein [Haladaptatus sp. W1]|uniref:ethanolamine ammonia-lyase reactivating factor EutA n=1 Tax=Haladaptatus sp. W1 TaxID=1897478 RepID=UPI0008496F5C|nr:ethanolamine ammonia-lyase reactivating factor EutA [Haladaptatus sp. W1]ODR80401.1 ethanolamine ammonia lyase-activating protein [Haladaptatus sp. W1]
MSGSSSTVLTSVGIDIGTTTTQVIISELTVSSSGIGAVSVDVEESQITYRGAIYETPLVDEHTLDVPTIQNLIESEFETAGYSPTDIDSGAVIVTGESSYKENAKELVKLLAEDTGEFVIATAGPELESVLAGYGSGAATRAAENHQSILNVDIGGGTTNMCLFSGSEVVETRCLNVGGRLLRFTSDGRITHLSEPAKFLIDTCGLDIRVGTKPADEQLSQLATAMVDAIFDTIAGNPVQPDTRSLTIGDAEYSTREDPDVMFSGGVGRLVQAERNSSTDSQFTFHDFGEALASTLQSRLEQSSLSVYEPTEDIRATVIGAGTQTTSFSGTTVHLDDSLLPLKNLPVIEGPPIESGQDRDYLAHEIECCIDQGLALYDTNHSNPIVLSLPLIETLSYDRISTLAQALANVYDARFTNNQPRIILTQQNCAKALAQRLRAVSESSAPLIVIDEIAANDGDYIDIGESIMTGRTVPVVVKSLVFGD